MSIKRLKRYNNYNESLLKKKIPQTLIFIFINSIKEDVYAYRWKIYTPISKKVWEIAEYQ